MTMILRPDGPACDEPLGVERATAHGASSGPTPVWQGRSGLGADRTGRRAGLGVLIGSFAIAVFLLVAASVAIAQPVAAGGIPAAATPVR